MTTILLVGAGGHARAVIDVIEQDGRFTVAGLTGLTSEVGQRVLGYPVLATDEALAGLRRDHGHALVAIGQIKDVQPRMRAFNQLQREGFELPSIVSPKAHVSKHAALGAGTVVMHGAVVNAGAVIGRNCIINSLALVEHDAVVGDHCHIATTAAINSGVKIGDASFIGSGVVVRQQVRIGERSLVGMGQHVLKDCPPGSHLPELR
jgi:sugar O-acyltransferase (sialic acid O-acetyltransferase NeuD family)